MDPMGKIKSPLSNEITAVVFVVAFTLAAPTEQIRPVEKGASWVKHTV